MFRISSGRSDNNWISFTAGSHTSRAIREPNGEIKTETVKKSSVPTKWINIKHPLFFYVNGLMSVFILYILPFIKGYKINPMIRNGDLSSNYYLVSVALLSILLIVQVLFTTIINDPKRNLRRNHGAEHKVFTAFRKTNKIPTINKAKQYSRICNVCGATIISALITGQLIGYFLYINYGFMIAEKVLFFVPIILHGIFPFNFFGKVVQFITTNEPNDDNIELAIEALTALMHAENPGYFITPEIAERILKDIFRF